MSVSLLIIDGDRWQREALATALACEGWHAEHTGDSASALRLLAQRHFQLVLFDPAAPTTGGWRIIEKLISLHPILPMIVLASPGESARPTVLTGASCILNKPIDFTALLGSIKSVLVPPGKESMAEAAQVVWPIPSGHIS